MTDKLPPNLLALFAARPPLRWVEPSDHAPQDRKTAPISGVAQFLPELQKYKETDVYHPTESWLQARDRKKQEKKEKIENLLTEAPKNYKPNEDPNVRGDAFKTLIVARLSYEADERDLEKEFGRFGPIERIRIVADTHAHEKPNKKKKPHRGYAFVVFEREKDMRAALDSCDGMRIKDRRIKVDVERGRTVKGWRPRRLGGGLGGRGYTRAMASRPMGPGGFGGGSSGGFRGGFKGFDGGRGRGGFRGGFGGRGGGFRNGGGDFSRGGDRGSDRGGDRGGFGAPSDAPSGPGFDRRNGGHGDRGDRSDRGDRGDRRGDRGPGGYDSRGGGRSYDDRQGGGHRDGGRFGGERENRRTGSNMEPIGRREGGYRERDRDYDRPRDDDAGRKRGYEGGYEDPRKLRRY
ncbi:Ff.00g119750.m01.CDS01 [Fusarium sp. VM40]|nr:U1 small nuclear ribonucleoprotein of 70kDa MW N terminal-domain-containing protein [Fusarium avenaceum]CAJ0553463.1 Ff.00g119750.m01.CDS01 [Fusarium sp. VM40]